MKGVCLSCKRPFFLIKKKVTKIPLSGLRFMKRKRSVMDRWIFESNTVERDGAMATEISRDELREMIRDQLIEILKTNREVRRMLIETARDPYWTRKKNGDRMDRKREELEPDVSG